MKRWSLAAACGMVAFLVLGQFVPGRAEEPCDAVRCRVKLDVTGELVAPTGRGEAALRRPIGVDARFDFEERPAADAVVPTVLRMYTDAVATMRIGDEATVRSLAADAREVRFQRRGTTPQPFLESAFLTADEHDLLAVPFDVMLIDDILPAAAVAVGEVWEIPADLAAGLLAIDTLESGKIEARLEDVVAGRARVTFAGSVDGWVDGVPTHVEVSGSLAASAATVAAAAEAAAAGIVGAEDAGVGEASAEGAGGEAASIEETGVEEASIEETGAEAASDEEPGESLELAARPHADRHRVSPRVDHLSAAIRERRQAGHVAPGLDVEARLVVAVSPVTAGDRPTRIGSGAEPSQRRRGVGEPGRAWHRDPAGRFDLIHDARWRMVESGPSGLVMRFVDEGALVAQCAVTVATAGSVPSSVADVRHDVEQSLAGQLTSVDEAAEEERGDGGRVVRIVSSGAAEGLPFTWIHYAFVPPHGNRVDITFMVQESMRGRFADADRQLVASLAVPAGDAADRPAAEPAAEAAGESPAREARAAGLPTEAPGSPR